MVMATAPPSPDPEWAGLPPAPPIPAELPRRPPSARRGRIAAGIGIAVAGHVPASGLWLYSFYTFVYSASPDSLFMVDCLVILLQLALFACCAVPGGVLVLNGDRGLGLGLLIGWVAGVIALVVGTILIGHSVPVDPTAAAPNMAHHALTPTSAGPAAPTDPYHDHKARGVG
ncbi:hypothetical protein [Micromonospora sp. IBHARD004]|uniref:hypothetical protein n=1 Tax=Micromonospora sp. IBHARD004 TaxID=3457764 RepID=UPI00405992BD